MSMNIYEQITIITIIQKHKPNEFEIHWFSERPLYIH